MSASTRCWHCGGSLLQFGRLHFADLTLRDGNLTRVHKCCLKNALESQNASNAD